MPVVKSPDILPQRVTPSWVAAFQVGGSCPLVALQTVSYEFGVGEAFIRNMLATLGVPVLTVGELEVVHVVALERAIFAATFPLAPGQSIESVMEWVQTHYNLGRKKAILELLRSTAPAARHLRYRVSRGGWSGGATKSRRGRAARTLGARSRDRAPRPGSRPTFGYVRPPAPSPHPEVGSGGSCPPNGGEPGSPGSPTPS